MQPEQDYTSIYFIFLLKFKETMTDKKTISFNAFFT